MIDQTTHDYTKFNPRDYLQEYYTEVSPENFALLQFTVEAFKTIPSGGVLLDFGGGPTIYPLIAAANHVDEIHFYDYLDANLNEVRLWLQSHHSAFVWQEFVSATLKLENQDDCHTAQSVSERKALIRQRVTRVFNCDLNNSPPIDEPIAYDIVITNFCMEAAANDLRQWREFFSKTVSLLKPSGFLLLGAVKDAKYYAVGDILFTAVSLNEDDLIQALIEEGFDHKSIVLESVPTDPSSHYEGLIMILAQKLG